MSSGGGGASAPPAGLTPMQKETFNISEQMINGNPAFKDPGARRDVKRYGLQMSNLAQGGLMGLGMSQMNRAFESSPMAPGIMDRAGARYGIVRSPDQQASIDQQAALTQAGSRIALENQARLGLAGAMRDMRSGGIKI